MTPKKELTPESADPRDARIYDLENQLEAANAEINRLTAQLAKPRGREGYLIRTPHAGYNGTTAGVVFRAGTAFLPDTPEGKATAEFIAAEFAYDVQHVDDWQDLPAAETLGRSLIDSLLVPERR